MEKSRIAVSVLLSFSLICLAAAIVYFTYGLIKTVNSAPALISQLEQASRSVDPVLKEMQAITDLIPPIIAEVAQVREQIPPILAEVEKLRLELPAVLDEVEAVRTTIPIIVTEVTEIRGQIPSLVKESQEYRKLLPEVLAEVKATRAMISPTMDRAESLIADVRMAGHEAGEGAMTGLFAGVIKAPFKMLSSTATALFGRSNNLTAVDIKLIEDATRTVIENGTINTSQQWSNPQSGAEGTITLIDKYKKDNKLCRVVSYKISVNARMTHNKNGTICYDKNNQWQLVE